MVGARWSGPPGFNCWASVAPMFHCWSCCWVVIFFSAQYWILICMFDVLVHWWEEVLHTNRTSSNVCLWTAAEPRARVVALSNQIKPPVIYYWPFQGGASIVVYSSYNCVCASCWSLTICWFCLGHPGGHLLGKSWLLGFPLVLFWFFQILSRMVAGEGSGIRLYRFLSTAFSSTLSFIFHIISLCLIEKNISSWKGGEGWWGDH